MRLLFITMNAIIRNSYKSFLIFDVEEFTSFVEFVALAKETIHIFYFICKGMQLRN